MKRSILESLRTRAQALALAAAAAGLLSAAPASAVEPAATPAPQAASSAAEPRIMAAGAPVVQLAALATPTASIAADRSSAVGIVTPAATPAGSGPNTLQSIRVQPLNGSQLQLTFHLSGPAPTPMSFSIARPARIALDLPNTTLGLPSRRVDVNADGVDSVLAAEADGRSRLVLDLDKPLPYRTRVEGNDIVLVVGQGAAGALANLATGQGRIVATSAEESGAASAGAATAGAADATDAAAASGAAPAAAGGSAATGSPATPAVPLAERPGVRSITNIDFRRSPSGAAQLIVRLSDPNTPIDLRQQGSQILIDFAGTALPQRLSRRYDTLDFGTPVSGFEAQQGYGDTHIVLHTTGAFDQLAYQTDDKYVVEVSPVHETTAAGTATVKKYKGQRLSLNFQNISVRAVLQLLADASGQNIVVSDSVTGNVTLRLQNVPWDQALDIVLTTKGLGKRQDGNVIIVAPADELAAREKADLASQQDIAQLEPLRTEYLQVNYAKAADIASLLKTKGTNSVLSARGSVSVDDRTNTLLLHDTPERLDDARRLVSQLDIPVKQVEIEARIVIVNNDFERDLGAILGVTAQNNGNGTSNTLLSTTGTTTGLPLGPQGAFGAQSASTYNVNLPVSSPAGNIAFGILNKNYLVDLELSAAQTENLATVISSPRVITANQQEAEIKQGVEIPYQQSASSGATTIAFKDAVLLLKVKPLITPDNRIILDLTVSDDSVGKTVVASGGVDVPAIDTRSIQTQVLLGDGETVVLGGILETQQKKAATKVPWLGDIPILGALFRTTSRVDNKDELLIFITPKILHEGTTAS